MGILKFKVEKSFIIALLSTFEMDFWEFLLFYEGRKVTMKLEAKCGEFQPQDRCREMWRGAKQKSFFVVRACGSSPSALSGKNRHSYHDVDSCRDFIRPQERLSSGKLVDPWHVPCLGHALEFTACPNQGDSLGKTHGDISCKVLASHLVPPAVLFPLYLHH